jgi:hypothetical protein
MKLKSVEMFSPFEESSISFKEPLSAGSAQFKAPMKLF